MISIYVDRGAWKLTLADGSTISGRCESAGDALRAATAAAARLEASRRSLLARPVA